ncbi:MAG TPA: GntR family transcriptional regulator [Spirochaetia bacterium]|nr:GntR family transcriptional regulator [Spirochaetia bacterium]
MLLVEVGPVVIKRERFHPGIMGVDEMEGGISDQYRSIQDIVFTSIRDDILSGKMKPGDPLNTVELAQRLGVSRTPIREALNRLIASGLVVNERHRGAHVRKLSIDEVVEIYYIRAALAGVAARLATKHMTESESKRLFELCDQMDQDLSNGLPEAMLAKNFEFHSIVYRTAKSPRLEALVLEYYRQSDFYRTLGLELPGRFAEISREHRLIAEGLASGDKDRAEAASRQHHFNTAMRIAKSFGINVEL